MDKSLDRYNTSAAILQYYRMQYPQYLNPPADSITNSFYIEILDVIKKYIKSEDEVVEVGCGLGRVLIDVANNVPTITRGVGIDISEAFITECQRIIAGKSEVITFQANDNFKKLQFAVDNAQSLQFKDNEFSFGICLNVIDRVPEPQKVADELTRVVRKGGFLVITDPYDWREEYTPEAHQVKSMTEIFSTQDWRIVEDRDIQFNIAMNERRTACYRDHLMVLEKLS